MRRLKDAVGRVLSAARISLWRDRQRRDAAEQRAADERDAMIHEGIKPGMPPTSGMPPTP